MKAAVQLAWVGLILISTPLAVTLRKRTVRATTLAGAVAAIDSVHDWSKWMAGIQTAALAGLSFFVFGKDSPKPIELSGFGLFYALAAYVFLGSALLVSAWVLSSTSSLVLRAHAEVATASAARPSSSKPDPDFLTRTQQAGEPVLADLDVFEQPIYAAYPWPHLGYILTLQHALWAEGLICAALLVGWRLLE